VCVKFGRFFGVMRGPHFPGRFLEDLGCSLKFWKVSESSQKSFKVLEDSWSPW
jgi:hypothetical protein